MTYDEWAAEYLQSAEDIQQRIDRLQKRAKSKNTPWSELSVICNRIRSLKMMQSDCRYSARQLLKHT